MNIDQPGVNPKNEKTINNAEVQLNTVCVKLRERIQEIQSPLTQDQVNQVQALSEKFEREAQILYEYRGKGSTPLDKLSLRIPKYSSLANPNRCLEILTEKIQTLEEISEEVITEMSRWRNGDNYAYLEEIKAFKNVSRLIYSAKELFESFLAKTSNE